MGIKPGRNDIWKKFLRHFFEQEMYKCKGRRGEKTPMEALEDDDTMNYILEYIKSKPKSILQRTLEKKAKKDNK